MNKNTIPDINNLRIFHGPENICGIGSDLADWQREEKDAVADFAVFTDNTNRQNSHFNLHLEKENPFKRIILKVKFFLTAFNKYDLFQFYFGKTLLPLNLDLPILKLYGKKIIMDYVGSDIRLHNLEMKRNPYYHLRDKKRGWGHHDLTKRIRMIWQGIWCDYCIAGKKLYAHALTSIPKKKILNDLWINTTINVPANLPAFKKNNPVVVMHAPSNFLTKGTPYVEKAVNDLHEEGLEFEFRLFHKTPHEEVIDFLINEADIVVDQLLSGGFGVLAMEAMTYAKPVCGYATDELRDMFPDLPIVISTVDTLKDQLRELIKKPKLREEIGRKSWEFAKKHYDRDAAYEYLWQIYMTLFDKPADILS